METTKTQIVPDELLLRSSLTQLPPNGRRSPHSKRFPKSPHSQELSNSDKFKLHDDGTQNK